MSSSSLSALPFFLLLLIVTSRLRASIALGQTCQQYNTTAQRDPSKLNVHLVPHTHDDSGWLKTFDQYFWGTRQDIQSAAVQHVLSTVVQCLKDNPDRRFSYAEMSFFSAWWYRQSPAIQATVRQLVADGKLDFINGGWVQHDEAAAHYVAMIDQTTRGHRFLNKTFGVTPRVAWQIDPFGHSSTHAALMSAAAGYEALFFGRADYQDMHVRSARKQLEMLWRASASWGEYGQIFAQNYPSGNYGPPTGFNFDWGAWDTPIVDDPSSPEYNVPDRVDAFVAAAHEWSTQMAGNDILFMMGSDFQYSNAHAWFVNLDRLIHYVNLDGRVNVLYSTPAQYIEAKASYTDVAWPVKTDDFFPYADCPHCYWTGYFTSRPTSKGYIRQATAYLNAARQLQALVPQHTSRHSMSANRDITQQQQQQSASDGQSGSQRGSSGSSNGCASSSGGSSGSSLGALEAAVSLTQHHDAVTGTEKQAVANDYARYLYLGMQEAADVVNTALTALLTAQPAPTPSAPSTSTQAVDAGELDGSSSAGNRDSSHSGGDSSSSDAGVSGVLRRRMLHLQRALRQTTAMLGLTTPTTQTASGSTGGNPRTLTLMGADVSAQAGADQKAQLQGGLQLVQCPLLNVSVCAVTVAATSSQPGSLPTPVGTAAAAAAAATVPTTAPAAQQRGQHPMRQLLSPGNAAQHISAQAQPHNLGTYLSSRSDASAPIGLSVSMLEGSANGRMGVLVVAYNSLAWSRHEVVRVPVSQTPPGVTYSVQDAEGAAVPSQLLHISQATAQLQQGLTKAGLLADTSAAATHELVFRAELPPLGYATFAVLLQDNATTATASTVAAGSAAPPNLLPPTATAPAAADPAAAEAQDPAQNTQLSNGILNIKLHAVTGRLLSVSAADGSWTMALSQELMWYKSSTGEEPSTAAAAGQKGASSRRIGSSRESQLSAGVASHTCQHKPSSSGVSSVSCGGVGAEADGGQSSGAYIFRPAGDKPEAIPLLLPEEPVSVSVVSGPVVTEIRQTWASWASLVTRLYAGADTLEQEWTVGPIPIRDDVGKEIVVRTTTDLQTGGVLFTDSNGREMLMRRRNYRPSWRLQMVEPVAGNYYPITAAAAVTDGCLTLGVATDRAQGAASLIDGQLEVMVHRVTIVDDARGVGEPLNETLCGCTGISCDCPAGGLPARGKHVLVLGPATTAAATLRAAQQQLNDPPVLAFAALSVTTQQQVQPAAVASGSEQPSPTATAAASILQQQQQQGVIAKLGLQGRWSGAAESVLAAGSLPANVHLLTLMRAEEADPSKLILRLAHVFQVDEGADLSRPVLLDLQQLLAARITDIQELSLTAAQYKVQQQKPRQWKAGPLISPEDATNSDSTSASTGASSSTSAWGQKAWRQLQVLSSCSAVVPMWDLSAAGQVQQQSRKLQRKYQEQQMDGPYNIWDHSSGDSGSTVQLFPQEIMTWLVTVEQS